MLPVAFNDPVLRPANRVPWRRRLGSKIRNDTNFLYRFPRDLLACAFFPAPSAARRRAWRSVPAAPMMSSTKPEGSGIEDGRVDLADHRKIDADHVFVFVGRKVAQLRSVQG